MRNNDLQTKCTKFFQPLQCFICNFFRFIIFQRIIGFLRRGMETHSQHRCNFLKNLITIYQLKNVHDC